MLFKFIVCAGNTSTILLFLLLVNFWWVDAYYCIDQLIFDNVVCNYIFIDLLILFFSDVILIHMVCNTLCVCQEWKTEQQKMLLPAHNCWIIFAHFAILNHFLLYTICFVSFEVSLFHTNYSLTGNPYECSEALPANLLKV